MTILNPALLVILLLTIVIIIILSFILIFKQEEKQSSKLLWSLFVLFIPVCGSIIYFIKYITELIKRKKLK